MSGFMPNTLNWGSYTKPVVPLGQMPLGSGMYLPGTDLPTPGYISPSSVMGGAAGMSGFMKTNSFDSLLPNSQGGITSPLGSGLSDTTLSGKFGDLGTAFKTETPGVMSSFLQQKNADGSITGGYGSFGFDILKGAANAYLGMKQYNLAKDTLDFNKETFWKNYDAQKTMTNTRLEDRQAARVASNPGFYQSVSDYMAKNGVK